jgi:hypothetical protein
MGVRFGDFHGGQVHKGGRPAGARNRLSHKFLTDLLAEYEEGGAAAIKIFRLEQPIEFVKLIAGILPKEFTFEAVTDGMSIEQLDEVIIEIRRQLEAPQQATLMIEGKAIDGKDSDGEEAQPRSRAAKAGTCQG